MVLDKRRAWSQKKVCKKCDFWDTLTPASSEMAHIQLEIFIAHSAFSLMGYEAPHWVCAIFHSALLEQQKDIAVTLGYSFIF